MELSTTIQEGNTGQQLPFHTHNGVDSPAVDSTVIVPYLNNAAGTLAISHGGTGQTTQQTAIDALLPSQTTAAGKLLTTNGSEASWGSVIKFGGDGSDSSLTVTSGTTTIDCAGAAIVIKNYTDITISGTGKLAFSNPHAGGTLVILRTLAYSGGGNVTLTSSTNPNIDLSGLGATAGTTPNQFLGTASVYGTAGVNGTAGQGSGTGGAGGAIWDSLNHYRTYIGSSSLFTRSLFLAPGAAGAAGGTGYNGGTGGAGGRGGGALLIECGGALNLTSTGAVSVSGVDGTVGNDSPAVDNTGGGGGGGGGSAGMCVILYNTLTANSGTILAAGGAGASGGSCLGNVSGSASGGGGGGGGGSLEGAGATGATSVQPAPAPTAPSTPSAGAGGGGGAGASQLVSTGSGAAGAGGSGGATSTKHYFVAKNEWFA